jgi:hypothetical protein
MAGLVFVSPSEVCFSRARIHLRAEIVISDPDITVRRKIVFLINTLLVRTSPDEGHVSANLHTPSSQTGLVHANSHASMISDPSSTETSPTTFKALRQQGLLAALISALTTPIPHGLDGEDERDFDLEESILRFVLMSTIDPEETMKCFPSLLGYCKRILLPVTAGFCPRRRLNSRDFSTKRPRKPAIAKGGESALRR